LLLMYWRFNSCSARSASAWSYGRPSVRPMSRSAFFSVSLSNSRVPEKSTSATVGRSSTTTISTSPWVSSRTSLNRPNANRARIAAEPLSSVYWSPTRKGSDPNTVPGSTRCRPSTRMSRTVKGSTAQEFAANARAATAETVRTRKRLRCFFIDSGKAPAELAGPRRRQSTVVLPKKPGDVVEQGDRHHHQQHRHATALQALHPGLGDAPARDGLPKIIHQVPTVQDGQREQVQHAETHADQGQEQQVLGQAEAGRRVRCPTGRRCRGRPAPGRGSGRAGAARRRLPCRPPAARCPPCAGRSARRRPPPSPRPARAGSRER